MCLLLAAPTSIHGVFSSYSLSQYCYLHFWKTKFGSMLAQGFLRVKGQAQMLLFVNWCNKYAIIEWPLFDVPTSTHGVFTSFSLSQYCYLHFWKNKVGSLSAQGFLRVKSQAKIMLLFVSWYNEYAIIEWLPFDVPTSTHMWCFLLPLVYLSAVAYISVEISLGLC